MVNLEIVIAGGTLYEGQAKAVHFRSKDREFEVGPTHTPILSLLEEATLLLIGEVCLKEIPPGSKIQGTVATSRKGDRLREIPVGRGIMKMEWDKILVVAEK